MKRPSRLSETIVESSEGPREAIKQVKSREAPRSRALDCTNVELRTDPRGRPYMAACSRYTPCRDHEGEAVRW